MDQIVESIRNVASMISDISTTTLSQTRDINDINTAVARLDQMTQQNSALVEESAAASEGLRHQANELTHLISQFVLPHSTRRCRCPALSACQHCQAPEELRR